ncbi:MAG: hypothetical protein EOO40_01890 [Deltaproteobacteria bacterium]|nr:MAG: hypothetical protein EOO40_01890 [Deltaproteobacteria bacterium]
MRPARPPSPPRFILPNPYTQKLEAFPVEDWREGWEPAGRLVSDGLPVIRLPDPRGSGFALLRPHFVLDRAGRKLHVSAGAAPTQGGGQDPLVAYIPPVLEFETVAREVCKQSHGKRRLGPPLFDKPLQAMPQDGPAESRAGSAS